MPSADKFCKYAQDLVRDALATFLPSIVASAPTVAQQPLYTYKAVGAKDMMPEPRPFRLAIVTVSQASYVDNTSVIKASLMIEVSSLPNDESTLASAVEFGTDVLGYAHEQCYAKIHEFVVTHDWSWLLYAEIVNGEQEEANEALVDSLNIDIYFNTPDL